MSTPSQTNDFAQQAQQSCSRNFVVAFLLEFVVFLMQNKKWWLAPIVVVLLLIGLLLVAGGTAAAPFIYTLF